MTIPSLFLGIIVSTLIGAVFHLWRGGGAAKLLLYLIAAWIGFWLGHFAGARFGLTFWSLGPLNLGLASISSIVAILLAHWLSQIQVQRA